MDLEVKVQDFKETLSSWISRENHQGSPELDWKYSEGLAQSYMSKMGFGYESLLEHGTLEAASVVLDHLGDYEHELMVLEDEKYIKADDKGNIAA